jgi:hypothetical protein
VNVEGSGVAGITDPEYHQAVSRIAEEAGCKPSIPELQEEVKGFRKPLATL